MITRAFYRIVFLALFANLFYTFYLYVDRADIRGLNAYSSQMSSFHFDIMTNSCLKKDVFLKVVSGRGWKFENRDPTTLALSIDWIEEDRARIAEAIVIFPEKEVPFAKEPGALYTFGKDGCMFSR